MAIALLTPVIPPYRIALFRLLAERHGVEVLAYGGGDRYVPAWFSDLDAQLAAAPFPARRLHGIREALPLGRHFDAVIAPFAGGALLPAAYAGARRYGKPFVLWASVWAQPRSPAHAATLPVTRHIYRHADAVVAYGEHVRRFVASIRGRDSDVFIAPQAVEAELFGRPVSDEQFREAHRLPHTPIILYVGRLVTAKGVAVLLDAWPRRRRTDTTLVVIGDGPYAAQFEALQGTRVLGPLPRDQLPAAYAAATAVVVPSIPTPRFREPWGLVCNEAMHQGRPVIATDAVGAVAGGLVQDDQTGLVVPAGDPQALSDAIDRLANEDHLRERLGAAARAAVSAYTYDAMADAFDRALASAASPGKRPTRWR